MSQMIEAPSRTVRAKLSAVLLPLVLAMLVGDRAYHHYQSIETMRRGLDATAEQVAERLSKSVSVTVWNLDPVVTREVVHSEMALPDIAGILVETDPAQTAFVRAGRNASWEIVDAPIDDPARLVRRERVISHKGIRIGRLVVYCTTRFVLAERNRLIASAIVSSTLMAATIVVSIYLILSSILRRSVGRLSSEARRLEEAIQRGQLSQRADTAAVEDEFRPVMEEVNRALDACVKPILLTADYTRQIANGQAPPRIEEEYPGDFRTLRDNLNLCIDALHARAQAQRLEIELRHSQKLEAVGRLAAGIAHEINTPIQFIGDNTRFLGEALVALLSVPRTLEKLVPAESREVLRKMEEELDLPYLCEQAPKTVQSTLRGVERVATIVRAMKEFAHPDQREMVATDLNRAIQATLEVARNEYKYVAEVETSFGELPLVTCHAGDLNQVVLNLIVNAAHAISDAVNGTQRKGKISIATAHEGEEVLLSVADTGTGIPEAIRDKVFDPFFTTKEVGRGTGQGLALARSIVTKHQGKIRFETETGRGTVFHIRIPIAPAG